MAVRGYVLAKTGWTLEYINQLPEIHLLFVYHHIRKTDEDSWNRLGSHLGTLWDRDALMSLQKQVAGAGDKSSTIFVPLSLVVNPDLPNALLGKDTGGAKAPPGATARQGGDGLHTEMAMPEGDEVINMGSLPREEFIGLVASSGLAK